MRREGTLDIETRGDALTSGLGKEGPLDGIEDNMWPLSSHGLPHAFVRGLYALMLLITIENATGS